MASPNAEGGDHIRESNCHPLTHMWLQVIGTYVLSGFQVGCGCNNRNMESDNKYNQSQILDSQNGKVELCSLSHESLYILLANTPRRIPLMNMNQHCSVEPVSFLSGVSEQLISKTVAQCLRPRVSKQTVVPLALHLQASSFID